MMKFSIFRYPSLAAGCFLLCGISARSAAEEPPAINPFKSAPAPRGDARPGRLELSDGKTFIGQIYLTRDKRLMIYDEAKQRQREIPLRVVKQIDCKVKKEWMEKEWRFEESAKDEKLFTGRQYPAREYVHTVTLTDGRTITGPLSGIVYIQPFPDSPTSSDRRREQKSDQHFILHKRDKGKPGQKLKELVYVKRIRLGEEALEKREGTKKGLGIGD